MADPYEQELANLSGRQLLARAMQMYGQQPDVTSLNEYAAQRQRQGQMDMVNALAAQYAGKGFQPVQETYLKRSLAAQTPQEIGDYGIVSGGKFTVSPFAGRKEQATGLLSMGNNILDNEEAAARQAATDRRADARQAASDSRYYAAEERRNRLQQEKDAREAEKEKRAEEKDRLRAQGRIAAADTVISNVDDAKNLLRGSSGGPLARVPMSKIPGTDAYTLAKRIDTVKANIGFDALQAMRESSPTGGALGQVAVQEINYLQSTLANLDVGLPDAELEKSLDAIDRHYKNIKMVQEGKMPPEYQRNTGAASTSTQGGMTPDEERELLELRNKFRGQK